MNNDNIPDAAQQNPVRAPSNPPAHQYNRPSFDMNRILFPEVEGPQEVVVQPDGSVEVGERPHPPMQEEVDYPYPDEPVLIPKEDSGYWRDDEWGAPVVGIPRPDGWDFMADSPEIKPGPTPHIPEHTIAHAYEPHSTHKSCKRGYVWDSQRGMCVLRKQPIRQVRGRGQFAAYSIGHNQPYDQPYPQAFRGPRNETVIEDVPAPLEDNASSPLEDDASSTPKDPTLLTALNSKFWSEYNSALGTPAVVSVLDFIAPAVTKDLTKGTYDTIEDLFLGEIELPDFILTNIYLQTVTYLVGEVNILPKNEQDFKDRQLAAAMYESIWQDYWSGTFSDDQLESTKPPSEDKLFAFVQKIRQHYGNVFKKLPDGKFTTCPKGFVWDKKLNKCVRKTTKIKGRGSYSTINNRSGHLVAGQHFAAPSFSASSVSHDAGGITIRHQEYVQTIYGNDGSGATDSAGKAIPNPFQYTNFSINPGLAQVFPMLAQFATNFENYEMKQCVFHFETLLDEGVFQSANGQVGDILMYSHMNPSETPLQNVSEFIQAGGSISRTTKGVMSGIECSPAMLKGLPNEGINKIRTGPMDVMGGTSEHDQATFQLAVSNTPTQLVGQPIGRLYVSYNVKLLKPKLGTILGRGQLKDVFSATQSDILCAQNSCIPLLPSAGLGVWKAHKKNQIGIKLRVADRTNAEPNFEVDSDGNPTKVAKDTERLQLVFPEWFQGTVSVDMTFVTKISSGNGDRLAPPKGKRPFVRVVPTGNVVAFKGYLDPTSSTGSHSRLGGIGLGSNAGFKLDSDGVPDSAGTLSLAVSNADTLRGHDKSMWKISLPQSEENTLTFWGDPELLNDTKQPTLFTQADNSYTIAFTNANGFVEKFSPKFEMVIQTVNDFDYAPDHQLAQGASANTESQDGLVGIQPETTLLDRKSVV